MNETSTEQFYTLTPERILEGVERLGVRCTGRYLALNSMENRVLEVEVEIAKELEKSPRDRFRVAKFYRPGRWTEEQIQDEHNFLFDLAESEIPVVPPLKDADGRSVFFASDLGIYYAVFLKVGGRTPQDLTEKEFHRLGRIIGRMHAVGKSREASHRLRLTPKVYGRENIEFLRTSKSVLPDCESAYFGLAERICEIIEPWFEGVSVQRIHGDCHRGNILWSDDDVRLVDFDDMVIGPPVQDFWLMVPDRSSGARALLESMLEGYSEFSTFDRETLRLIEPLRALRYIHFTAWIARRWEDPSFKTVFTNFGTPQYWREQIADLQEQLEIISGAHSLWLS